MKSGDDIIEIDAINDQCEYTLREFCELCGVQTEYVVEMVETGVLTPVGQGEKHWRFSGYTVSRLYRAQRLQRDLEINLPGVALSLELLDDLEEVRAEVRVLRQRLAQLHRD
ncbi:MAG: chaperone modulator CbpM [Gammaproteobacteria bacterium]|nr:chaperone modulator CbpM [Gammaproteobacteria bacterium]